MQDNVPVRTCTGIENTFFIFNHFNVFGFMACRYSCPFCVVTTTLLLPSHVPRKVFAADLTNWKVYSVFGWSTGKSCARQGANLWLCILGFELLVKVLVRYCLSGLRRKYEVVPWFSQTTADTCVGNCFRSLSIASWQEPPFKIRPTGTNSQLGNDLFR